MSYLPLPKFDAPELRRFVLCALSSCRSFADIIPTEMIDIFISYVRVCMCIYNSTVRTVRTVPYPYRSTAMCALCHVTGDRRFALPPPAHSFYGTVPVYRYGTGTVQYSSGSALVDTPVGQTGFLLVRVPYPSCSGTAEESPLKNNTRTPAFIFF